MDLQMQIMNLKVKAKQQNKAIDQALKQQRTYHDILVMVYQLGHKDARHDAAELVELAKRGEDK